MLHYVWIYIGLFLEGELVFISAIITAHHGYLNIWLVISIAAIFATIASWLKRSKWAPKLQKVQKQLELHRTKFLISYRFIYGLRMATPLVLETQDISFKEFLKYCIVSTIIWAIVITSLGRLFGELILRYFKYFKKAQYYIIGGLLVVAVGFIVLRLIRKEKA